jgi:hypothetical protein
MRDASALPTMTVEEYFRFREAAPQQPIAKKSELVRQNGA